MASVVSAAFFPLLSVVFTLGCWAGYPSPNEFKPRFVIDLVEPGSLLLIYSGSIQGFI